ncbi:MAG: arsenate reductase (glutaredoxin) [Pseudomonadota bacterium]
MSVTIYHNPRCSKSRATLALLEERGVDIAIVKYLETPPSVEDLKGILFALGLSPREVLRKDEAAYKELGLADEAHSDDALIEAMAANPILIERPIVVRGGKAVIGRPPERVLDLI